MRFIMIFIYLVLILLGVSFATLNASSVQINLYVTTVTLPVSLLMTLMLGFGLVIGFCVGLGKYWCLKVECLKIKNQLKLTEKEIKNLRNIPLKDQH